MRNHRKTISTYFFILILINTITCLSATAYQPNTGTIYLVDTIGREPFVYDTFMKQAHTSGFNVTYVPFDRFVDTKNPIETFNDAQGFFFILGLDFLIGLNEKSPLSHKILHFYHHCVQQKNKLIGLIFPSLTIKNDGNGTVNKLGVLFNPIIYKDPTKPLFSDQQQHLQTIEHFLLATDEFLTKPLISRPCGYHTTLQAPRQGIPFYHRKLEQVLSQEGNNLMMLPKITRQTPSKYEFSLQKMLPFGLYWFNPIHQNHIFITSNTALTFSSIKEDFHFCPVHTNMQTELNTYVSLMLEQLNGLQHGESIKQLPTKLHYKVKKNTYKKKLARINPPAGKKTAWMELVAFQEPSDNDKKSPDTITQERKKRTKQQNKLIDYIFDAQLDTLWISVTPNILYSPIAREKHREKQILDALSLFTQKLQQTAQEREQACPKLLLGFEITNNIYDPNLPKSPAVDIYGTTYQDLPSPLNKVFWHNEIIASLKQFTTKWKNPAISHGIELSGIMIDLEMYCRRKSGTFLETMGFDKPTFTQFLQHKKTVTPCPANAHDMVKLLEQKHLCQQYFSFLEQEAQKIGTTISQEVDKLIPGGIISCYVPNILVDWFYKGFMKGLTHDEQPLHLFTFNSSFIPHMTWFNQQNINVFHSSVLLLSKLETPKDFNWINNIFKHHHGLWLNRFSRLVEEHDPKNWAGIEQTPLNDEGKTAFLEYLEKQ